MNDSLPLKLTVATRTSKLALWQTEHIIQRLQAAWPGLECETVRIITAGDKTLDKPLPEIGGKGLFTLELEDALRTGAADIAVHSLKDLPVEEAAGLTLGAITDRADVRDGLVARNGWTLATLPSGAVVGTSSLRRQAQLLAVRPDLRVKPIRGNVDTRVRKVLAGEYDAALLAMAGLQRLGLADVATEWLDLSQMLPAPGQGALAVQCRAGDESTLRLLAAIHDENTRKGVAAERAFLSALGGGCSAPVAALAMVAGNEIRLETLVASTDGGRVLRTSGSSTDPETLGQRLAQEAIASGAAEIMALAHQEDTPLVLEGKRIVVTRPKGQVDALSRKLADWGASPLEIPMIRIASMPETEALDQAIQSLGAYDWVIFTSVNGVSIFWDRLLALAGSTPGDPGAGDGTTHLMGSVKIATVGPATAGAVIERGAQPTFTPDEFVGEAVAEGLGEVRGLRFLLPRAEMGRKTLPDTLRARGAEVVDLPIYRTLPADLEAEGAAELAQGVDIVTFTSSSAVRSWAAQVGALPNAPLIACIGPVTARTATELGLNPTVIAEEYTSDGLVRALVEHFQDRE